jgi:hypothetical protein
MRRSPSFRLGSLCRCATFALAALVLATPGSAQFGGLKKRLKGKAAEEGVSRAAGKASTDEAGAATPAAQGGGTIVLTSDVVSQLLVALKAGQAERDAAAQEDTPYGRYQRAQRAYTEAGPKCEAERQAWAMRGDEKSSEKANALIQKMLEAQAKHDYKLMQIYQDSVSLLQGGPSCVVKKPEQPKDYYDAEREIEVRAEKAEVKASGWRAGELAMVKERTDAILRGATAGDISASEKSAVTAKAAQLKPLMGFEVGQPAQAKKAEPAPAPAPVSAAGPTVDPQAAAAANKMGACMAKNIESHKSEIESLQKQAEAAQKAGDQGKLMQLAQRMQQIQMAGCMGH